MAAGRAGFRRRAEADGGLAGDQHRLVRHLGVVERLVDGGGVMAVHFHRGPASALKTLAVIDRVRQRRVAIDLDRVVVPQHHQLVELEMAGDGDGFLADAFLKVAIRRDHPGAVVHQIIAVMGVHDPLAQRHADRGREPLTQRTGGGLDARRMAELRVASSF